MELYVLRHGTTKWNEKHLLQGRSDIPLDEGGIRLAQIVGEKLKDVSFDICYSSPLARALQTAQLVLGGRSVSIVEDPRLMEMSFGEAEGRDVSASSTAVPKELLYALSGHMENYPVPEGGESVRQVYIRTARFIQDLLENPDNNEKRILISTHGAAGRALMHHFWGGDFWHGNVPPNCSFCIVTIDHCKVTSIEKDIVLYDPSLVTNLFGGK
ncbi:MAG: histidine phosphatase family protein [Lachnospiraceae bacterium]|nr:histidine phosphatase family protein [Lachnospiraceae bacterium]